MGGSDGDGFLTHLVLLYLQSLFDSAFSSSSSSDGLGKHLHYARQLLGVAKTLPAKVKIFKSKHFFFELRKTLPIHLMFFSTSSALALALAESLLLRARTYLCATALSAGRWENPKAAVSVVSL